MKKVQTHLPAAPSGPLFGLHTPVKRAIRVFSEATSFYLYFCVEFLGETDASADSRGDRSNTPEERSKRQRKRDRER
jgi:hypothetical protein